MDLALQGQTALVVGGANGIGRAIAAEFLAEGAHAAIWDIHDQVETLARELSTATARCWGRQVDATDSAAVDQALTATIKQFGRVDHIVYAAGVGSGKFGFPFWNLSPSDWDRVVQVCVLGAVNVAHAVAPRLTAQRSGSLLFISSVAGQIGSQTDPPYSASKAALINFAQCAARDLAPYQVRVNTICPGMIRTELNRAVWQSWVRQQPAEHRLTYEEWAAEKIAKVTPLGRWQEPRDVAALAVFLASSRGSNITGQTMNVDGGQVMHW